MPSSIFLAAATGRARGGILGRSPLSVASTGAEPAHLLAMPASRRHATANGARQHRLKATLTAGTLPRRGGGQGVGIRRVPGGRRSRRRLLPTGQRAVTGEVLETGTTDLSDGAAAAPIRPRFRSNATPAGSTMP